MVASLAKAFAGPVATKGSRPAAGRGGGLSRRRPLA